MEHMVGRIVGRSFFRIVRRWPIVFAAVAAAGEAVGVWGISFLPSRDWTMVLIGVLCITFYTGLLVLLVVKLWRGTWGEFCDWAESLFHPDAPSSVVTTVQVMNAQVRANACPSCGQPLGDRKPGSRTITQILWGGWTCPDCGVDVDRHGKIRLR
jgi:hypothetical protein